MELSSKQIERLMKLEEVKINGIKLNDEERIFLCWLLKREYSDLYLKIQHSNPYKFSQSQAKDEMITCLKLLTLVERSNKKWILELNLSQKQAKVEENINA